MPFDHLSLDMVLHMAGLAFVIGMWFAAIMGMAQICRVLRVFGNQPAAGGSGEKTATPVAPRTVRSTARPLFVPTLASR